MAFASVSGGSSASAPAAPAPTPTPPPKIPPTLPKGFSLVGPAFQMVSESFAPSQTAALPALSAFHAQRLASSGVRLQDLDSRQLDRLLSRLNGSSILSTSRLGEIARDLREQKVGIGWVADWLAMKFAEVDADLDAHVRAVAQIPDSLLDSKDVGTLRHRPHADVQGGEDEEVFASETDDPDDESTSGHTHNGASPEMPPPRPRGRPRKERPVQPVQPVQPLPIRKVPLRTRVALKAALQKEGLTGWAVRVSRGKGLRNARYRYVREYKSPRGGPSIYRVSLQFSGMRQHIPVPGDYATQFDAALVAAREYRKLCNGDPSMRPGAVESSSDDDDDDHDDHENWGGGGNDGDDDDDNDDDDPGPPPDPAPAPASEPAPASAQAPSTATFGRTNHRAVAAQAARNNDLEAWRARVAAMAARLQAEEEAEEAAEAKASGEAAGPSTAAMGAMDEKAATGEAETVMLDGEPVLCDMQYCRRPVISAPYICEKHTVCVKCVLDAIKDARLHRRANPQCPGCTQPFSARNARKQLRDEGGPSGTQ